MKTLTETEMTTLLELLKRANENDQLLIWTGINPTMSLAKSDLVCRDSGAIQINVRQIAWTGKEQNIEFAEPASEATHSFPKVILKSVK